MTIDKNELSRMRNQIYELHDRYKDQGYWETYDNWIVDKNTLMNSWTREQKMALLHSMLKPGTEVTIQLTDEWLHRLLLYNPGVLAEAERLKEQLTQIPWHAERAADEGDNYWLRLAGSYQGD